MKISNKIPKDLQNQLKSRKVIPFVGAGVSITVCDKITGTSLFPSWVELLYRAVECLEEQNKPSHANLVRALLDIDPPDYLEAAKRAHQGLGPIWYKFLKEQFDHSYERVDEASLELARLIWELGSSLIITTNYDKVLHWACPQQKDLSFWDIQAEAEFSHRLHGDLYKPTVWHLHGYIDNAVDMILTPDGYNRLYPENNHVENRFKSTLETLRFHLASNTFIFIGFSLNDKYVGSQLESIYDVFKGTGGPHYVLTHKTETGDMKRFNSSVENIPFCEFGKPLLDLVCEMKNIVNKEILLSSDICHISNMQLEGEYVETKVVSKVTMDIIINKDFDSFTDDDLEQIIFAIRKFLTINDSELRIINKYHGSIRLTIELPEEAAEQLLWAIKAGEFENYSLVDAEILDYDDDVAHETISPSSLYTRIATELALHPKQVERTVSLLLDDATVPFIAHYRKEATGNMDEEQIRQVVQRHKYYQELEQRRNTIFATIEGQGKLTDFLRQQILDCFERTELEDLYLPYRPKRQTKASMAIERGLEPLAQLIWKQQASEAEIQQLAETLVNAEKNVPNAAEALTGVGHIIAEWIADRAELRKALRTMMLSDGLVRAAVVRGKAEEKTKFQDYYDFREPVASIPSHRILSILRGVREGVLSVAIEIDDEQARALIRQQIVSQPDTPSAPYLLSAVDDAYQRLLLPSLQNEVRGTLKTRADSEAISVFQENLRNLLMSPPLGALGVIGIDPGLRTGCKVAVVDETGKYLEDATIYPLVPRNDVEGAEQVLQDLLNRFTIKAIAVGNGTGSHEATTFVRQFLRKAELRDVSCVIVNEAGASVYSASKVAREEFPDLDVTVRGAISIARHLQDPLAELVKIDPKSIGVGQYQHDVDQKPLRQSLAETVESCVNRVGVDINTASAELLQHVSGLNMRQARNVVLHRDTHGRFTNRQQFLQVNGVGEKAYQQAIGFLRIKDGDNILDNTAVHPETYRVVEQMAQSLDVPIENMVANEELINSLELEKFADEEVGLLTLHDIREELRKPGRDPREQFIMPHFRDDVTTLENLEEGMVLEGVVSNISNFGAFVDIGVHQDGLVHSSELSKHYVRDPREIVQVGQVVRVRVLRVDQALQRISLSMKLQQRAVIPARRRRKRPVQAHRRRKRPVQAPRVASARDEAEPHEQEPEPELSMAERLRALKARFSRAPEE